MLKFAATAVLCSAGVILVSETAQARCGCRRSCCSSASTCAAPAPTCCAPAPSCAAPAGSGAAPQPYDATPPAPTAGLSNSDPALAQSSDGRQTFRSYSYDSAQPAAANAAAPTTKAKPPASNFFRANRKMLGIIR